MPANAERLSVTKATRAGDALERRQADMSSHSAESLPSLDAVLAVAPDAMITVDERGGVLQWNLAAERMFGYSREQALGRAVAELVIPPKRRRASCSPASP